MPEISLIECNFNDHATPVLEILNYAIQHTTALYDYKHRTIEDMEKWFQLKHFKNYPVIGAINENNQLLGFATYGSFRERHAYKYTVEHSVYTHPDYQKQGIGKLLMQSLINRAIEQNYHTLIGIIDTQNRGSINFHEKLGFQLTGHFREIAFKFNQWLDCAIYQLILPTPVSPNENLP